MLIGEYCNVNKNVIKSTVKKNFKPLYKSLKKLKCKKLLSEYVLHFYRVGFFEEKLSKDLKKHKPVNDFVKLIREYSS